MGELRLFRQCCECSETAVLGKSRCEKHMATKRTASKAERERQKALGLCGQVGCKDVPQEGFKLCAKHREYHSEKNKVRYAKAREAGRCISCKNPATSNAFCEFCWFKHVAITTLKAKGKFIHITAVALQLLWNKQSRMCALTGDELIIGVNASLDHIVPSSLGGTDAIENLQWVTYAANRAKGDLTIGQFIAMCERTISHSKGK